jgi:hypothetical protein
MPLFDDTSAARSLRSLGRDLSPFCQGPRRGRKGPHHHHRRAQEESETCYCDSGTIASRAPTLGEFSAELALVLPDMAKAPNVCGLPVSVEIRCPSYPTGDRYVLTVAVSLRRQDGTALTGDDLDTLETIFLDSYNTAKESLYDACHPRYQQLSTAVADRSVIGEGLRRHLTTHQGTLDSDDSAASSRLLQVDPYTDVSIRSGGSCSGVCTDITNIDDVSIPFASALRSQNFEVNWINAVPSPNPTTFPSEFPSEFPSVAPSTSPSSEQSLDPCWLDGSICVPGTNCNNCCNPAYDALGTQCGGSCWVDGSICAGTTCNNCCNGSEYWDGKLFTACGAEPCWEGGSVCLVGTSCGNCCGSNFAPWYTPGIGSCNEPEPCWSDGSICSAGTTCNNCCNQYDFWDGSASTACGVEPCWLDGSICVPGTNCNNCCNPAYDALGTQFVCLAPSTSQCTI